MNPLRRVVPAGFLLATLGLQLWTITPMGAGSWYWPFMDYPMYRDARPPGDPYRERRVAVVAGRDGSLPGDTVRVTGSELGIYFFVLEGILRVIATHAREPDPADSALVRGMMDRVDGGVRSAFGDQGVRVLLEERSFEIGRRGLITRDPPWVPLLSWIPGEGPGQAAVEWGL